MHKNIQSIELAGMPPAYDACFDVLHRAAPDAPTVLFGGAARDADYAAYYGDPQRAAIHDYDLRVLLPDDDYDERVGDFVARFGEAAQSTVREVPSAGTGRIRHCVTLNLESLGVVEMDVSLRKLSSVPNMVAGGVDPLIRERIEESDIGLSSIAVDQNGIVWAAREYPEDRNNRTLTVYPRLNAERRLREYAERMLEKFPNHKVIWLADS